MDALFINKHQINLFFYFNIFIWMFCKTKLIDKEFVNNCLKNKINHFDFKELLANLIWNNLVLHKHKWYKGISSKCSFITSPIKIY